MVASAGTWCHCAFKMPQNPQYRCPRRGNMYQDSERGFYCSHHDYYAKNRCQAYFEFQGSGMRCPELYTMIDLLVGQRLCAKHDPTSTYSHNRCQAIITTTSGEYQCPAIHTAIDERSDMRYCDDHLPTPVVGRPHSKSQPPSRHPSEDDTQVTVEPPEVTEWNEKMFRWLNDVAIAEHSHVIQSSDLGGAATPPEQTRNSAPHDTMKAVAPRLPEAVPEFAASGATPEADKASLESRSGGPTLQQGYGRVPEPGPEHPTERIAALYKQCNICLEKHNLIDMREVEPCGHEYKEACLRHLLRRRGARRFNCTSCAGWLKHHQAS